MQEKKKIMLIVISVLVVLIGVSFAYLAPQIMSGVTSNANVQAGTTDDLSFNVDKDINLSITQFNLTEGGNNLSDRVIASASLKANNTNNTASYNYYVYFNIETNNYVYTTTDNKPEIILTVTDPSGNAITSIDGLTYVTSGSVSGFDITTKKGLIKIATGYPITSNSSTTATLQNWTFNVSFINLTTNQKDNAGKTLNAKVMIQKDEIPTIGSKCAGQNMASCIKENYQLDSSILLHNASLTNGANDGSYRYSGASETTNNYVCFGSDAATCPTDNLYRIIGVFGDQVKIIKLTTATSAQLGTNGNYDTDNYYSWDNSGNSISDWATSLLNKTNLNTNYLNNIGSTWSNKIATTTWKVGGNTYNNIAEATPSNAYKNEIVSPIASTTYSAKIGLMYVSDYGFAASQSSWATALNSYNSVTANNWMAGIEEWTLTKSTSGSTYEPFVFYVSMYANIKEDDTLNSYKIKPTFYLLSSTVLQSGSGTAADPYRIQ